MLCQRHRFVFLFTIICLGLGPWSGHAVTIPKQLSQSDRRSVVQLLGVSTSTKIQTNPFPLGGYDGLEIGLSLEMVNISELNKLGCAPSSPGCPNSPDDGEKELRYPRLTVGKGLYNNLDLFLHFSPQSNASELISFGGALRYSFYEARFLPVNLALVASGDHTNFSDQFESLTLGADLTAGIYVDNFALFAAAGVVQSRGTFIGGTGPDSTIDAGDPSLSAGSNTVSETVTQGRTTVGLSMHFTQIFVVAQVDRYPEDVYSVKAGLRF